MVNFYFGRKWIGRAKHPNKPVGEVSRRINRLVIVTCSKFGVGRVISLNWFHVKNNNSMTAY